MATVWEFTLRSISETSAKFYLTSLYLDLNFSSLSLPNYFSFKNRQTVLEVLCSDSYYIYNLSKAESTYAHGYSIFLSTLSTFSRRQWLSIHIFLYLSSYVSGRIGGSYVPIDSRTCITLSIVIAIF